ARGSRELPPPQIRILSPVLGEPILKGLDPLFRANVLCDLHVDVKSHEVPDRLLDALETRKLGQDRAAHSYERLEISAVFAVWMEAVIISDRRLVRADRVHHGLVQLAKVGSA